jgi:alkylresorcinol/alkylpyrone synthase
LEQHRVPTHPRIAALATATPPYHYRQRDYLLYAREAILGPEWSVRPELAENARLMERLFDVTGVEYRQSAIDLGAYYRQPRTTGERMAEYQNAAPGLGRSALEACLRTLDAPSAAYLTDHLTDLITVSCTGYSAPGLDIHLARDLGLPRAVRRVVIGHMGCFGALVGIRQCLATVRADPDALAALVSVELCSLHFTPTLDPEVLTSFALFGDAAAALLLTGDPSLPGPAVVDTYCAADFGSADQMSWTITDFGFRMGLSPRVPITLRRNVSGVVANLLDPHDLRVSDITHWLIHPGGPSILEVIQRKLELSDEQMAPSWQVLREHGNCSSATVLLILDELVRAGAPRPGEWGVMMAFGPGLTLETCLLRF